jgi:D-inositol-3-phosphate glycosyltransferase
MVSSQLKIAMLSAHSCPVGNLGARDTGGMSVYIRELASHLGKQGHTVDVYTRAHDPRDPQIVDLGENARLIHLRAGIDEEIHKLALYSHLPDFACNTESFRKNNGLKYELVFSHYWLSSWVGKYLQQWWHVPHITMFHTLGAIKNAIGIGEDEPELRIVTEKEAVKNCQQIIATTEQEKRALIRHYGALPEKISVIPCGVNLELFQPIDKGRARQQLGLTDGKIILFVGRIEPLKGLDQLIRAMPHLPNIRGLKLVIIGGDEYSQHEIERLQGLSSELHLKESVTFRGLIKHEQLPYFYSAADACVVPSYYESFGLVALESLACGTPVVATDVGDLKNIIRQGETGYVLTDNTPQCLADKIALLLSKPPDKKSAFTIRASISRFGWTNISETVVRELRPLLAHQLAPVS